MPSSLICNCPPICLLTHHSWFHLPSNSISRRRTSYILILLLIWINCPLNLCWWTPRNICLLPSHLPKPTNLNKNPSYYIFSYNFPYTLPFIPSYRHTYKHPTHPSLQYISSPSRLPSSPTRPTSSSHHNHCCKSHSTTTRTTPTI